MDKKKKHADFQNEYRRSSNIGKNKEEDKLKTTGDGGLKLTRDEEMKKEREDKKISEVMDDLLDKDKSQNKEHSE